MKPIRNPSVQTKLLPDGHVVLFSQENDWAHTLTPLAGIAWEYCDGELSEDEIVKVVADAAGSSSDGEIKENLQSLFTELRESGLLQAN